MNKDISMQENAYKNVVLNMSAILYQPQCGQEYIKCVFPYPLSVAGLTIFIETAVQITVVRNLDSSEMQYFLVEFIGIFLTKHILFKG